MALLKDLSSKLVEYAHNPAASQEMLLNQLKSNKDTAVEILDPSDPVVYLAEMGVALGHAGMEHDRMLLPKIYPALASSVDDVYRHMSDKDHIDIFHQPSSTVMYLLLSKNDVMNKAVPRDSGGVRRLIIPRDTEYNVAGYTFTQQYPIQIQVLEYGALRIVWDTSVASPISDVSSNALDWEVVNLPNSPDELLRITVPVRQYKITTYNDTISPGLGWSQSFRHPNKMYLARVFIRNDSNWVEIAVSYSSQLYDSTIPTAVVRIGTGAVNVSIPEVYINSGTVRGDIRVDIYSTHGELSLALGNYMPDDYELAMRDISGELNKSFYTPLESFSILQPYSDKVTVGGRDALTFRELRDTVIDNATGPRKLPVSDKQLVTTAETLGMEITKPIDYVTGRIFHASAKMPKSTIPTVSSPIGTVSLPLDFSVAQLDALSTVRNNGLRKTITPDTLYEVNQTNLTFSSQTATTLRYLRNHDLVTYVNKHRLLYSPFHYVIDTNTGTLSARPYHLISPVINNRRFVLSNETTEIDVVTGEYQILKQDSAYVIRIVTKSRVEYKEIPDEKCFVQLSFVPRGYENTYAHIDGVLVGNIDGERVWEFTLSTNYDIDRNDELIVGGMSIVDNNPTPVPVPLDVEFNVVYGVEDIYPDSFKRSSIDDIVKRPNRGAIGVTHEQLTVELGKSLKLLWAKSRPITGTIRYRRYTEDVYATHPDDVVSSVDVVTGPEGDDLVFTYAHRKDDPILVDGSPVIKHLAGDVVKDSMGSPVVENGRHILYRSNLCVFDARYLFATTDEAKAYRDEVNNYITTVVTDTLPGLGSQLLERTHVFFKPKTSMGEIEVRVGDGTVRYVSAEFRFFVKYYLTTAARRNMELLKVLGATTRKTISEILGSNTTVSVSDITSALKTVLGDAIVSVEVSKLGPEGDIDIYTVLTPTAAPTISKRLEVGAEGAIEIHDDITISYLRHD